MTLERLEVIHCVAVVFFVCVCVYEDLHIAKKNWTENRRTVYNKQEDSEIYVAMLVTMDPSSGPQSRLPIMNSPTLARVERARIRLEAQALNNNDSQSLERRILDPKVSTFI